MVALGRLGRRENLARKVILVLLVQSDPLVLLVRLDPLDRQETRLQQRVPRLAT